MERCATSTVANVTPVRKRGVTPRKYLNSQETIYYESRPSIFYVASFKLVAWAIVGSIILLGLAALTRSLALIIIPVWFLAVILPLLAKAVERRAMFFTLTDQRILSGKGYWNKKLDAVSIQRFSGMMDVQTPRVTEVVLDLPRIGQILGYGHIVFRTTIAPIQWRGVKHPTEVRRYVEETINRTQEAVGQQQVYKDEVIRTMARIKTEEQMGKLPQPPSSASLPAPAQQSSLPSQAPAPSLPTQTGQESTINYCAQCGAPFGPGTRFCPRCGTPVATPREKTAEEITA